MNLVSIDDLLVQIMLQTSLRNDLFHEMSHPTFQDRTGSRYQVFTST